MAICGPLYIVEKKAASYLDAASNYLVETDIDDAAPEVVIRDLMNDQHDGRAVRVWRLVDATAEFREKLQAEINRSQNGTIPDWLSIFMAE